MTIFLISMTDFGKYGECPMIKKLLCLLLFVGGLSFADDMCVDLCGTCEDEVSASSESCLKISETCRCQELKEARLERERIFEEDRQRLGQSMVTCEGKVCAWKVVINDRHFIALEKGRTRLPSDSIQAKIKSFEAADGEISKTRVKPLAPMGENCQNVCSSCELDEKTVAAHAENGNLQFEFSDNVCKKINVMCKCFDYAVNAYLLERQRVQDSVENLNNYVKAMGRSMVLAEKLLNKCTSKDTCEYAVTLYAPMMKVLDIYDLKKMRKERSAARESANTTAKEPEARKPTAKSEPAAVVDSSKNVSKAKDSSRVEIFKFDKTKIKGSNAFMFYFGWFEDETIGNNNAYWNDGLKLGVTWFYHWSFHPMIKLQAGAGLGYRYSDGDIDEYVNGRDVEVSYTYNDISIDLPLMLRIGYPVHKYVFPYISGMMTVRKPFCVWLKYNASAGYTDYSSYSYYYGNSEYNIENWWDVGFYDFSDWEFDFHLGIGVELKKRFLLEFQLLLGSGATGNGHDYEDFSWRVNLQSIL